MGGFSLWHWLIVGLVILLLFGKGRFSDMMGDVAKGLKSFKKGMSEDEEAERSAGSTAERPIEARPAAAPPSRAAPSRPARPPTPTARPRRQPPEGAPCSGSIPANLLIIAVVALVVIGPKDLPRVMRTVGHWVGRARGMAAPFPRRPRHDDPRGRARGHGEEVEGRQRADHARASRRRRRTSDWAEPVAESSRRRRPEPRAEPPPAQGAAGRAASRRRAAPAPPIPAAAPAAPARGRARMTDLDRRRAARGERARQEQGAAARPSDRAAAAAAVVLRRARRRRSRVCLYFADRSSASWSSRCSPAGQGQLIYTEVFEAFFVEIKVAFFAALMISFPIIANQLWPFVAPGLYAQGEEGLPALPAR